MLATIHSWWTAALLLVFIGIVVWAYSSRRKKDFEQAANLALDEEDLARGGKDGKDKERSGQDG